MSTRRDRRRQETIDEILAIAEQIMAEQGVNGLSLSEVARRLGVKPPSIYKYFDSLMGIYDALFARGQHAHLEALRAAASSAKPGMAAVAAMLDESGRWAVAHPGIAQLLFWRPVPGFEPTPEAMTASNEMVALIRSALSDAVAAGELGPKADSDEAVWMTSILVSGAIGQTLANEPALPWGEGRFSPLLTKLVATLTALYPPKPVRAKARLSKT